MDIKQLLQYNEYQNKIYIHNEIFEELKLLHDKGSSHVAFAYTYYFLICWLYRYAKYGELNIDVKMIKQIMGYSATYQEINYLIKKNGWLDQNGLTYSDTNYPLVWEWKDDELEFTYLSDMDVEIKNMYITNKGRNYKIKVPVKALHRNKDDELLDGTFYDISYTHEVSFDLFVKCVSDKELGCSAFYLYGYLKYRCDKFKEYNSSVERLAKETGMSKNTVDKYLTSLCRNGLVKYKENECKKINGEFNKKANTYIVN
jgi:hypothetical protein